MQIPFKNGEPIYPIPEGYTFVDPEAIVTKDPTTNTVIPKTTRVVEEQNDGPDVPRTGRITVSDPTNTKTGFKTYNIDIQTDTAAGGKEKGGYTITDPATGAVTFITNKEAIALNMSGIQSGGVKAKTNFQGVQPPELTNIPLLFGCIDEFPQVQSEMKKPSPPSTHINEPANSLAEQFEIKHAPLPATSIPLY